MSKKSRKRTIDAAQRARAAGYFDGYHIGQSRSSAQAAWLQHAYDTNRPAIGVLHLGGGQAAIIVGYSHLSRWRLELAADVERAMNGLAKRTPSSQVEHSPEGDVMVGPMPVATARREARNLAQRFGTAEASAGMAF